MTDQEKLCEAVDRFAESMKVRLLAKHREGFSGWDDGHIYTYKIPSQLFHKALDIYHKLHIERTQISTVVFVDIANFAMMLWRKTQKGKGE